MRLLIIGGCGFVGCNLAFHLCTAGHEVTVLDNLYRRGSELNLKELQRQGIEFHAGDIRNREDLDMVRSPDIIILTAAQSSAVEGFKRPRYDVQTNLMGVINVLQFARRSGAGLIFFSSNKVYDSHRINELACSEASTRYEWRHEPGGQPCGFDSHRGISEQFTTDGQAHGVYGWSKLCADLACQEWHHTFGVETVVNRFSCIAGSRQFGTRAQGWLAWWTIAAILDLELTYFGWSGKQVRDVLFIDDVNSLIEMQIAHFDRVAGHVFNVGGGIDNTLSLLEATARLETKLRKRLRATQVASPRLADHRIYISDATRVRTLVDWQPRIGLDEGLEQMIEWLSAHRKELRELYS